MTLLISGHNLVTMLIVYSKLSSTFSPKKKLVQPARDRELLVHTNLVSQLQVSVLVGHPS